MLQESSGLNRTALPYLPVPTRTTRFKRGNLNKVSDYLEEEGQAEETVRDVSRIYIRF